MSMRRPRSTRKAAASLESDAAPAKRAKRVKKNDEAELENSGSEIEESAPANESELDSGKEAADAASAADSADELKGSDDGEKEAGPINPEEASFFASTLKSLVAGGDEDANAGSRPRVTVLAKRKTKELKEIAKHRIELSDLRTLSLEKKALRELGLVRPELANPSFERNLRKVATRGVVTLFNAIQTHQNPDYALDDLKNSQAKSVKSASKESFLDMLKSGGKAKSRAGGSSGWGALKDTFGVGQRTLKDFDRPEDEEDEKEQEMEESSEEEIEDDE